MKLISILNPRLFINVWRAYWRIWVVVRKIRAKDNDWFVAQISLRDKNVAQGNRAAKDHFNEMHESVRLAARLHGKWCQCLPRSIALSSLLRQQGENAEVCLGVVKRGDALASHAWVEVDGQMVSEPQQVADDFRRLIL